MNTAREFWKRIETIHAVTYFAPESRQGAKDVGLRGFWMGYFGFRAAPLGAVAAGVVEATFYNFAPSMVANSVPDVWSYASPSELVETRARSAATALTRAMDDTEKVALEVNDKLRAIVDGDDGLGRLLFAANRSLPQFDDPSVQLWQHCTTLREHRGDGHVAVLATHRVDGCEAHRLFAADDGPPATLLFESRGWSEDEWAAAAARLRGRGLLGDQAITSAGRELRATIEAQTDQLALVPLISALGEEGVTRLIENLTPLAAKVVEAGILPFPNPMGLPQLQRS